MFNSLQDKCNTNVDADPYAVYYCAVIVDNGKCREENVESLVVQVSPCFFGINLECFRNISCVLSTLVMDPGSGLLMLGCVIDFSQTSVFTCAGMREE